MCPLDRILYRGGTLDLSVYSRAELKGSDHKPGIYTHAPFEGQSPNPRSLRPFSRSSPDHRCCKTRRVVAVVASERDHDGAGREA